MGGAQHQDGVHPGRVRQKPVGQGAARAAHAQIDMGRHQPAQRSRRALAGLLQIRRVAVEAGHGLRRLIGLGGVGGAGVRGSAHGRVPKALMLIVSPRGEGRGLQHRGLVQPLNQTLDGLRRRDIAIALPEPLVQLLQAVLPVQMGGHEQRRLAQNQFVVRIAFGIAEQKRCILFLGKTYDFKGAQARQIFHDSSRIPS
jgi:hypothetical protein